MRRMMKLVIERSVDKLLKTVERYEIVDAVIARLDINNDYIAELVADTIDPKDVARNVNIRGEVQKEFEEMDFSEDIDDAVAVHVENVDWGDWVDMPELANQLDVAELAQHLDADEIIAAVGRTQGSFYDNLTKMVRKAVSHQVQSPVEDVIDIPGVGKITMVDRVIDRAATKLLNLCESTLELGDEADENNNTEDSINGASSIVSVPAT